MRRGRVLASVTSLALAVLVGPGVAGSSSATRPATGAPVVGSSVRTDEVCFAVHNEGDPVEGSVYGVRYYGEDPGPRTKVILLVHGGSVTHAFWDVRPDFRRPTPGRGGLPDDRL